MTVEYIKPNINLVYTGPGDYTFPFLAYDDETIHVLYYSPSGGTTELANPADYTVTLASVGGTVHATYAETSGTIQIYRQLPIEQNINFVNNMPLDLELIERAFDEFVMILQQFDLATAGGLAWQGVWGASTDYEIFNICSYGSDWYICNVTHTSSSNFTTDLAQGYWTLILEVSTIEDLRDEVIAKIAAEIAAQEATLRSYVDKASLWANGAENVEVEPGKYSALHFAAKSEDFSIASAGSASSSSNSASAAQAAQGLAESARDGAQLAETNAEAAELKASKWSDEAENVEVEPGRYSAFHWSQKAEEYASSVSTPSDEAYGISWDGSVNAATRNALYDKFELVASATQSALDGKEPSLGNPAMDGYVLSSTTAGVRSWVEVPKSGLQTVPGLDTTGNIMGFNLSKTGANQVTVSKGSCLDSTLTVPLALTADTAVAIPAVANTIYHIFVVKLVADGSMSVRAYTTEAGVASDGTVDKWRWVGFVGTSGNSSVKGFVHNGDRYRFDDPADAIFISGFTSTSYILLDISTVVPSSRVSWVRFGFGSTPSADCTLRLSVDGTHSTGRISAGGGYGLNDDTTYYSSGGTVVDMYHPVGKVLGKVNTGSASLTISELIIRR